MKKQSFNISGMSCSACSARVYKAVDSLPAVQDVSVNLLKNSMLVLYDETALSEQDIINSVRKAGYEAFIESSSFSKSSDDPDRKDLKCRLIASMILTLFLMFFSMGKMLNFPFYAAMASKMSAQTTGIIQFLIASCVVFLNFDYFKKGCVSLFHKAPNMDSLVALGAGAAFIFSAAVLYRDVFSSNAGQIFPELYFESTAMILTLITLGRFLENGAKNKANAALEHLTTLAPQTATVVRNGVQSVIALDSLKEGDTVVVKTGERLAADGIVLEGRGVLDESALTGESRLVKKTAGDPVMAASINTAGYFLMRADKVGQNTVLAQIIRLVDEATSSKAPIARLADRVSGVFVPVVMLIGLVCVTFWLMNGYDIGFALSKGISVLVISCPCALGLATPTAIMVGSGRAALQGVLFKSSAALEMAGRIDCVVLDKTGTVTKGKPSVTDILSVNGASNEEIMETAVSLEKMSEHTLAAAFADYAKQHEVKTYPVDNFQQMQGKGIGGFVNGVFCRIGNAKILKDAGIARDFEDLESSLAQDAKTVLYCVREKEVLGIIGVADPVKKEAESVVSTLKRMGISVILLTGDNHKTASAVAKKIGVDDFSSEMLPQDKENKIRFLQNSSKKVAMAGDGINDAPALSRADIGIAIGSGTDIALECADVVLMKSDLNDLVFSLSLGRAVLRNIKENLFWAFFYNSLAIPVAAGVFYHINGLSLNPMIAAGAMSFSSVCVVLNALRLQRFSNKSYDRKGNDMKKNIMIEGMKCEHCSNFVAKALKEIDGVDHVSVDLSSKTAQVQTSKPVADDVLRQAVEQAGFEVKDIQ